MRILHWLVALNYTALPSRYQAASLSLSILISSSSRHPTYRQQQHQPIHPSTAPQSILDDILWINVLIIVKRHLSQLYIPRQTRLGTTRSSIRLKVGSMPPHLTYRARRTKRRTHAILTSDAPFLWNLILVTNWLSYILCNVHQVYPRNNVEQYQSSNVRRSKVHATFPFDTKHEESTGIHCHPECENDGHVGTR